MAGGGQGELGASAPGMPPMRITHQPSQVDAEAGAGLGFSSGPGASNAHAPETSWRELLGIHSPTSPGPKATALQLFSWKLAEEDLAVICGRMAHSPSEGEKN